MFSNRVHLEADNYMLKVNNRKSRKRFEMCSNLFIYLLKMSENQWFSLKFFRGYRNEKLGKKEFTRVNLLVPQY